MRVFVLRADYGRYTDVFRNNNYIGIGWFDEINHQTKTETLV